MQTMLDQNPQHAAWSLRAARRAVVAAAIVCLGSLTGVAPAENPPREGQKTAAKPLPPPPWIVNGRVTDEAGRPIEGAEVRVNAGMGTLGCTGITETDRDGRYSLRFGPGILGPDVQSAIVHASTPGRTDRDLGRQGFFTAALKPVQKSRHVDPATTFLPNQPRTVDFVLVPSAKIELTVENDQPVPIGPTWVTLVGDTMPPGCSVAADGTTNDHGMLTLYEVPTGYAWRFEVRKLGSGETLRSRPFTLPKAREYGARLQIEKVPQLEASILTIRGFGQAGKDVRNEVLGEDPFAEQPPGPDVQKRGHELLRKIGEANRYWLDEPPGSVKTWSYTFHDLEGTTTHNVIPADRDVPLEALHGTFYVPALRYLTKPDQFGNILIRGIDERDGTLRVWYTFLKPLGVRLPNGRGNGPINDVRLVVDAKTLTPREHAPTWRPWYRETFADFVPCAEGTYAPRSIHVDGFESKFDLGFDVYEPGLWLFAENRSQTKNGKRKILERMDDVVINGQPGVVRKSLRQQPPFRRGGNVWSGTSFASVMDR